MWIRWNRGTSLVLGVVFSVVTTTVDLTDPFGVPELACLWGLALEWMGATILPVCGIVPVHTFVADRLPPSWSRGSEVDRSATAVPETVEACPRSPKILQYSQSPTLNEETNWISAKHCEYRHFWVLSCHLLTRGFGPINTESCSW